MIAPDDRIEELLSRVNVLSRQVKRSLHTLAEEDTEDIPNIAILRDYQLHGVHWMTALHEHNLHGIIADEMGLGKTLQIISFLMLLADKYDNYGPHLMIGPLSVLSTWASEIEKFSYDEFNVHVYYGEKEERENDINAYVEQYNRQRKRKASHKQRQQQQKKKQISIILTTYSLAINDISVLRSICRRLDHAESIEYLIVDEAHRIKRQSCVLHQRLRTIPSKHRILLTGTPLQNNVHELWSLLRFLNPKVFTADEDEILAWFNRPFADNNQHSRSLVTDESGSPLKKSETRLFQTKSSSHPAQQQQSAPSQIVIEQLQQILQPFMLRRLKQDVAVDIPSKVNLLSLLFILPYTCIQVIRVIKCPLTPLQQELTQILRQMVRRKVNMNQQQQQRQASLPRSLTQLKLDAFDDDESLSSVRLGKAFILLRKLCNHPFLALDEFMHVEDTTRLLTVSGKLLVLHAILQPLLQQGSKVLIFSQMTSTLDIIEEYLSMQQIACFRIDGLTSQAQRQASIYEFSQPTSQVDVFLLTTPAGGVGINLQVADVVILFDQDWNPQQDLQAIGRAHRIGQKKAVLVLRLVSVGLDETTYSIEERMLQRAMRKLQAGKQILATTTAKPQKLEDGNDSDQDSTTHGEEEDGSEDEDMEVANGEQTVVDEKHFPFKWTSLFADKQSSPTKVKADRSQQQVHSSVSTTTAGPSPCSRATHSITFDVSNTGNCFFDDRDLAAICQRTNSTFSDITVIPWQDDDYVEIIVYLPTAFLDAEQHGLESLWHPRLESFRLNMLPVHSLMQHQHAMEGHVHGPRLRQRTTAVKYSQNGSLMIDPYSKQLSVSESAAFLDEDDSELENEYLRRSNNKRSRRTKHKLRPRLEAQYSPSPFSDVYRAKRKKSQRGITEVDGSNSSGGRTTNESYGDDEEDEDICVLCGQAGLSNEEVAILTRLQSSLSQEKEVQYDIEGDMDTMILCDGCDGAYHTICVGLQVTPEEDWFCSWCQHQPNLQLQQQEQHEHDGSFEGIIVIDSEEEN